MNPVLIEPTDVLFFRDAVPMDVAKTPGETLARLELWRDPDAPYRQASCKPSEFSPLCLPMATTPPDQRGQLHGWWSIAQMRSEDRATAAALATRLHWQPRSDFYGEKGCGYGLVSFDLRMHPSSVTLPRLAQEVFV